MFLAIFIYLCLGSIFVKAELGDVTMLRYKYALTNDGQRRVSKNEFYLQETPKYRGYTERIFRALYGSDALTIAEISYYTGIDRRSVNGVITFNLMAGYIKREHL
jgi:hypothetical protein